MPIDEREEAKQFLNLSNHLIMNDKANVLCTLKPLLHYNLKTTFCLSSGESRTLRELIARPSASRTISNPRMFIGKSRSRTWKKAEVRDVVTSGNKYMLLLIK